MYKNHFTNSKTFEQAPVPILDQDLFYLKLGISNHMYVPQFVKIIHTGSLLLLFHCQNSQNNFLFCLISDPTETGAAFI
jgi:hypothetical protein